MSRGGLKSTSSGAGHRRRFVKFIQLISRKLVAALLYNILIQIVTDFPFIWTCRSVEAVARTNNNNQYNMVITYLSIYALFCIVELTERTLICNLGVWKIVYDHTLTPTERRQSRRKYFLRNGRAVSEDFSYKLCTREFYILEEDIS